MKLTAWRSPRRWVPAVAVAALTAALVPLALPASAAATRYEAENATISQGAVASNHTGFSGTGFVDYTNVTGSYVQWSVNAAAAGTATLTLRYANGTTVDRPMDIAVNGTVVAAGVSFPATANWDTWASKTDHGRGDAPAPTRCGPPPPPPTAAPTGLPRRRRHRDRTATVLPGRGRDDLAGHGRHQPHRVHRYRLRRLHQRHRLLRRVVGQRRPRPAPPSVVLRYANGTTVDRPMDIAVNGTCRRGRGVLPARRPTGTPGPTRRSPCRWPPVPTPIRATATTANGGPNVDKLTVPARAAPVPRRAARRPAGRRAPRPAPRPPAAAARPGGRAVRVLRLGQPAEPDDRHVGDRHQVVHARVHALRRRLQPRVGRLPAADRRRRPVEDQRDPGRGRRRRRVLRRLERRQARRALLVGLGAGRRVPEGHQRLPPQGDRHRHRGHRVRPTPRCASGSSTR